MKWLQNDEIIYPFLIFAEQFQFHRHRSPRRFCLASAFYLIESGSGRVQIEGEWHQVTEKSLVYIPASKMHIWESSLNQSLHFRCAYFDWKYIERDDVKHRADLFLLDPAHDEIPNEQFVSAVPNIEIPYVMKPENFPYWQHLFTQFSDDYDTIHHYSQRQALAHQAHFHIFLKYFLDWMDREDRFLDPRIKEVVEYMEKTDPKAEYNYIYEIVHKVGLSRSYFQTLFKNQVGSSPRQYWNQVRIQKAKEDLKNTSLTISQIAKKYNYSTVHYFSKSFKLLTGESPSDFRKKNIII